MTEAFTLCSNISLIIGYFYC